MQVASMLTSEMSACTVTPRTWATRFMKSRTRQAESPAERASWPVRMMTETLSASGASTAGRPGSLRASCQGTRMWCGPDTSR